MGVAARFIALGVGRYPERDRPPPQRHECRGYAPSRDTYCSVNLDLMQRNVVAPLAGARFPPVNRSLTDHYEAHYAVSQNTTA